MKSNKLREKFERHMNLEGTLNEQEISMLGDLFIRKNARGTSQEYFELFKKGGIYKDPALFEEHYRRKIPGASLLIDSFYDIARKSVKDVPFNPLFVGMPMKYLGRFFHKGKLFGERDCELNFPGKDVFREISSEDDLARAVYDPLQFAYPFGLEIISPRRGKYTLSPSSSYNESGFNLRSYVNLEDLDNLDVEKQVREMEFGGKVLKRFEEITRNKDKYKFNRIRLE